MSKSFGGVHAVADVSMDVRQDELVGLVGPNGAGKSTLLAAVSGHLRHDSGSIALEGNDVSMVPAFRRAQLGIRRSFQVSRLLPGLSVIENVRVGALAEEQPGLVRCLVTTRRSRAILASLDDRSREALRVVGVSMKSHLQPQQLSYGELRLVEVARALISRPKLLLLDEPAAGLNTAEAKRLGEVLQRTLAEGAAQAVVLVEHNLPLVVSISTRMLVLNFGELIAAGPPNKVVETPRVRQAYTGG